MKINQVLQIKIYKIIKMKINQVLLKIVLYYKIIKMKINQVLLINIFYYKIIKMKINQVLIKIILKIL